LKNNHRFDLKDKIKNYYYYNYSLFGSAVEPAFDRISIFSFAKIECGLYLLDRFDVLMSKMIFKK
jgi:hypothetical protein